MKHKRIGLIARLDNGGLGIESIEYFNHIKPVAVLAVVVGDYPIDKHRFKSCKNVRITKGVPKDTDILDFCNDIDVLFSIETFYNDNTAKLAKSKGVKTFLKINYEWLPQHAPAADVYIAPLDWYYSDVPEPKVLLQLPVNTKKIKFIERKTAKTFVHVSGHTGVHDRNGTQLLLDAIKKVKSDVTFLIYSQNPLIIMDNRVTVISEVPDYSELYSTGDVMILPRRYAGQSLVLNEALAAGLPVLMTDMKPQSNILPDNWLIPTSLTSKIMIKREIEYAAADIDALAQMIDLWANQDISYESNVARSIAEKISWDKLLQQWLDLLNS